MMLLAELSLWVALLMSVWATLVSLAGARLRRADLVESGSRSAQMIALMLLLASLGLWQALLRRDYSVAFVASHTTSNLPDLYAIAAFWSAEPGWLLCFALVLSVALLLAIGQSEHSRAYVTGLCAVVLSVVLARVCLFANPFVRLDWIPSDGLGLLPPLQHPRVQLHLLLLFVGCALSVIASVFGISPAAADDDVARPANPGMASGWAFHGWLCVTAAMLIGMWGAYRELGWISSWMLYPVESAEIFLWLTLSALLLGAQRKWINVITIVLAGVCLVRAVPTVVSAPIGFADQASGSILAALLILLAGGAMSFLLLQRKRAGRIPTYGTIFFLTGVILLGTSVGAARWSRSYDTRLASGTARDLTDAFGRAQRTALQSLSEYDVVNRELTSALVAFTAADGHTELVAANVTRSVDSRGAATSPASAETGIGTSLVQDFSVRIRGIPSRGEILATIGFEPLVELAWAASALVLVGGALALRPRP